MKRLSDIADAVILSPGKIEDSPRRIIEAISDLVTKTGFVNIDIEDMTKKYCKLMMIKIVDILKKVLRVRATHDEIFSAGEYHGNRTLQNERSDFN